MRLSVTRKGIFRIFDFSDQRSGQFCDLPIIRQWEKPNPFYTHQVRFFYHELSCIRLLMIQVIQVYVLVSDLPRGHLGSPEVTNTVLLVPHD